MSDMVNYDQLSGWLQRNAVTCPRCKTKSLILTSKKCRDYINENVVKCSNCDRSWLR